MRHEPADRTGHTAADLEVPPGVLPATSDADAFVDDGLGRGDDPDVQTPADGGS